jgi:omega-amidase
MQYKIALGQMHIEVGKLDKNQVTAFHLIEEAARQQSSLILLPELWSTGYDLENSALQAQASPAILTELIRLSRLYNISIGGSLLEAAPEGIYNTFAWVDPKSEQPIFYRKTHLFRLMDEEKWITSGNSFITTQTDWGLTGLAICYDLRFPEVFRRYALDGATAIAISAEWPVRRIAHWQVLLRARAIENQSFVFATNCVGPSPQDQFGGRSTVVSPWGDVLVEGDQSREAILYAEIDTSQVKRARNFMPVFQERRPDLYSG